MPDRDKRESLDDARERLRQAIQDLHRSAGLPSSRAISAAVRKRDDLRDTVSHETVNAILRGEGLPRWVKLESLARQLADWAAHRPDPDLTVREVQELWLACQEPASDDARATRPLGKDYSTGAEIATQVALERSLTVVSDDASLSHRSDAVEVTVTRQLVNDGEVPLGEYPVKVSVDRFPEEPEKSIDLYRRHPLTWSDLAFEGHCNGKPMAWAPSLDRPNAKRLSLLFENEEEDFPVLPGESAVVAYSYMVPVEKWGPWFQRKVSYPTRRIAITLDFPAKLRPTVWGERVDPLRGEGIRRIPLPPEPDADGRVFFRWVPREILFRSAYRVSWGFRNASSS